MSATVSSGTKPDGSGVSRNLVIGAEYIGRASDAADKIHHNADHAVTALNGIKYLSAQQAFRLKDIFASQPILNSAGNLRGLVTSKTWHHVYELTVQYAEGAEAAAKTLNKVADFMGWANYLSGWAVEIDRACESNESWDVRAQRLSFYATTALVQTVAGTAHGITDVALYGAQKACQVAGATGMINAQTAKQCSNYGQIASASVAVYYKAIDDATTPEAIQARVTEGGIDAVYYVEQWYDASVRSVRNTFK